MPFKITHANNEQTKNWESSLVSLKKENNLNRQHFKKIKAQNELSTDNLKNKLKSINKEKFDLTQDLALQEENCRKIQQELANIKLKEEQALEDKTSAPNQKLLQLCAINRQLQESYLKHHEELCAALKKQMEQADGEEKTLRNLMEVQQNQIEEAHRKVVECETKINTLAKKITDGDEFIRTLNNLNVLKKLNNQMLGALLKAFVGYDYDYPIYQNTTVQMCLYKVREKLEAIRECQFSNLTQLTNQQVKYLMICGFLWDIYGKVQILPRDEYNLPFIELVEELLLKLGIENEGELPNIRQLNLTPAVSFQTLKNSTSDNAKLFDTCLEDFKALQPALYEMEKSKLLNQQTSQSLLIPCRQTIQDLDKSISEVLEAGGKPDYKTSYEVARVLNRLCSNPFNPTYQRQVELLANGAPGLPSLNKQITGGLTAALGAALVISSITLAVLTFGATTLPSAFGVALGISLMGSQVVLGVAGASGLAAGLGLTVFGAHRNVDGQRKGFSKDFTEVKEVSQRLSH